MPSSISHPASDRPIAYWRLAALYAGWVAPPLAWLASLEAGYAVSYLRCAQDAPLWTVHAAVLGPLAVVGAVALWLWRAGRGLTHETTRLWPGWMVRGAWLSCAWFSVVIAATDVPIYVVLPCR